MDVGSKPVEDNTSRGIEIMFCRFHDRSSKGISKGRAAALAALIYQKHEAATGMQVRPANRVWYMGTKIYKRIIPMEDASITRAVDAVRALLAETQCQDARN